MSADFRFVTVGSSKTIGDEILEAMQQLLDDGLAFAGSFEGTACDAHELPDHQEADLFLCQPTRVKEVAAKVPRGKIVVLELTPPAKFYVTLSKIPAGETVHIFNNNLVQAERTAVYCRQNGVDHITFSYIAYEELTEREIAAKLTQARYIAGNDKIVGTAGILQKKYRRYIRSDAQIIGANRVATAESVCSVIHWVSSLRKQMKKDLFKTETEKQAILDALPDTLLVFDQDGNVLKIKEPPDFVTVIARNGQIAGGNIANLQLPDIITQSYLHCIHRALQTGKLQFYEYSITIGSTKRYREARFSKIGPATVLTLLRDTTETRSCQEQVKFLSMYDVMTGLYNRNFFEKEMEKEKTGQRTQGGVAVVMCDVDGLKLINDTMGHAAGDEVLRIVATALHQTFTADSDVAARIGGDEFAVITYHPSKKSIEAAIEKFQEMIAKLLRNHSQLPVSVSVGWAADYNTSSNMGSLCKEADHTMYRKKLHQSQSMRSAIVQTMMKALKARDYITEGHVERLQNLVENMGKKLGISDARLADLQLFAQFHDIGKVGISDQILNKEGKLTPEEFTVMKRHSDIGFRIALASPDLMPIAELILKHHEWWNGGGYPMGISGRKIPLECRILALADAYDAMTNDRPYRKALAPEVAICELRRCAGSQFDPHLVELFIELLDADLRSSIFSGKSLNHNLLSSGNALPAPKGKLSELYAINKM